MVVTYSEGGPKQQRVGSFSVQRITVNGKYRSLPSICLSSEFQQNLAVHMVTVTEVLYAASHVDVKLFYEKKMILPLQIK